MNILFSLTIIITIQKTIISKTLNLKIQKSKNLFRDLKSISPLYGNSKELFYYYTNLYIGEKKEKQTYIIDTGSSVTTSPCSLCENCGTHLNSPFQISNNEILQCNNKKCKLANIYGCNKKEKCDFSLYYSEGSSLEGCFVDKIIYFEDNFENENNNISIPIGCTIKETHLFVTQLADGIMGLGNRKNSFVSILKNYGIIKNDIFSICLGDENGYFSIEEINYKNHYENIKYTNYNKNEEHYYIKIKNIEIYDIRVKFELKAFIDSGSTLTYMPSNIGEVISNKIKEICNKTKNINKCGKFTFNDFLNHCYEFNNNDEINYAIENIFPDIIFNINNDLSYFWSPKNYFIQLSDYIICLGLKYSDKFLLGDTWMKEYDIIFNKENFSIGFAASNCNKEVNLDDKKNWERYRKEREDKLREEVLGEDKEKKDEKDDKDKEKEKEEKGKNINNNNFKIYIYIGIGIFILITLTIYIIIKLRNKSSKIKEFNFSKITNEEVEMEKAINKLIESPLTP